MNNYPMINKRLIFSFFFLIFSYLPAIVNAEPGLPAVTVTTNPDGSQEYTVTLQILFMMTALTLLPAALIMMTSFTRIIIVLSILRQAIGLQQSPSNQILLGMALFLTLFIMTPTLDKVNELALQPYLNNEMTSLQAVEACLLYTSDAADE